MQLRFASRSTKQRETPTTFLVREDVTTETSSPQETTAPQRYGNGPDSVANASDSNQTLNNIRSHDRARVARRHAAPAIFASAVTAAAEATAEADRRALELQ